jgi:hypothetical protein
MILEHTTPLPLGVTPCCGEELAGATAVTGDPTPSEGDLTICGYCGAICRFRGDLSLARATQDDLALFEVMQPNQFALLKEMATMIVDVIEQQKQRKTISPTLK